MRKTIVSLLLYIIGITVAPATTLDHLVFSGHQLSAADGLSSNTVYDMLQDRHGFVWMGASYGLCRYDGYRFTDYYSLSAQTGRRMDANVGNLYEDTSNGRLWIHSATFSFACYNEQTGRFDDYTGRGDEDRAFRKSLLGDGDIWMYDSYHGARHVRLDHGRYLCTDYNKGNGRLPSDRVQRVVRDRGGNSWILTSGGLVRVDGRGHVRLMAKGNYLEGNVWQGQLVCLSDNGRVDFYDTRGRCVRTVRIPFVMGQTGGVRGDIVWQDQWLLFCGDTWRVNLRSGRCDKPAEGQISNGRLLDAIDGYYFVSNGQGVLWVYPPKGRPVRLKLMPDVRFTAERNRLYSVARGKGGLFYIATYGNGLFVYDPVGGQTRHLTAGDVPSVLGSNVLTDIMATEDGTLWVAQESAGVVRVTVADQSIASFVEPEPGRKGDWANFVRMIDRGPDGRVLFSTRDNRLHEYHPATGTVSPLGAMPSCVYSLLVDSRGRTWMATRNDGLYIDGVHYDKDDAVRPIPSRMLVDMAEDCRGRVWIATTEEGLLMAEPQATGAVRFTTLLKGSVNEGRQSQVVIDRWNRLWVATNNGIYMADTRKPRLTDADFTCFDGQAGRMPFHEANSLCAADDGSLWVGSKGHGVVRCVLSADGRKLATSVVAKSQGLAGNNVMALLQDRFGQVWVATDNGLSVIYDRDLKVRTFQFGQSFGYNNYSPNAALRLPDGRLAFGSRNGLVIVTPADMKGRKDYPSARVCVTDLSVNGRPVMENPQVEFAPGVTRNITLSSNENTVTFYYSNFDYSGTGSVLYQCYLEGVDHTWRPMTSQNSAEYASLRPGTYVFHVRSLNGNRWSDGQTLTLTVMQPWYNSLWAWLLYAFAGLSVAAYLYYNAREKLRMHQQMAVDRQLTEFRLNFFTNIAHEFRTPLAVIQGAVDKLRDGGGQSRAAVQTARRGTRRLLRLVNQLMEFRKMTTGNMRLQVETGDIVAFIHDLYQDFWSLARQKDIAISFTPFDRHYTVPFDRQMVETMVYNLLSNAVKYTPRQGHIEVTLRRTPTTLLLAVKDDGPGIDETRRQHLFQPFMRGDVSQGGMGIGLYTAHRMALMHHGSLDYEPVGAGGGSLFMLTLPAVAEAYSAADYRKVMAMDTSQPSEESRKQADELIQEMHPEAYNDVTVIVVEDDPDMMEQIKGELSVYFHVVACGDGESGLAAVEREHPALVVCDVMLPGINGYEVVKRLRASADTADTAVVMLTALDDDAHQLRSYAAGADDYMVKPCNFRLLVARCIQLVQRAQLMARYKADMARRLQALESSGAAAAKAPAGEKPPVEAAPKLITTQADKLLKEKMQMLIAQHISDPDFTVERLAAYLGMGRTTFFLKAKSLVGMSPNKYLQNERMRMAADLLAAGELTVAEVSYRVGIQDASYFNKCFKARYGVVPSKYTRNV